MAWTNQAHSTRAQSLPSDWVRIRKQVLERDHYTCTIQTDRCVATANQADHIGNPHDHSLPNLRAACPPCHATRSAAQGGTAWGQRRAHARRPREAHPGSL